MARHLIVNADDLGLSEGVNEGIAVAVEHGIVTSTSLMVRQPAALAGAEWACEHPAISVGIHVDLCEWDYVDGTWVADYLRVDLDNEEAVRAEVAHQFRLFELLVGSTPTHVDSHQHIHRSGPAGEAITAAARAIGAPLRDRSRVAYVGSFYGQDEKGNPLPDRITADALADLVASLPDGWSELGCHPGFADDVPTSYRDERRREVAALCDPDVRARLDAAGVTLASFRDAP